MLSSSRKRLHWFSILLLLDGCDAFLSIRIFGVIQPIWRQSAMNMMEVWWDGRYNSDGIHQMPELEEDPDILLLKERVILDDNQNQLPPVWIQNGNHLKDVDTKTVGVLVYLKDASGQEQALAALGSVEWILVASSSWQFIPAENFIAAAQSTGTKLAFGVDKASDVAGLARALELGVDALCVNGATATTELWKAVFQARKERNAAVAESTATSFDMTPQIVTGSCWRRDTKGTVLADRVCVDLVQTLLPEEGCWIGSSAKTMALVLSEAASSQFVPTRPFRVNAGPVHSYILLADDTTKYLCELKPADKVLIYNAKIGSSRAVAVGRLKEEVRPCVLVELQTADGSQKGQAFFQQAETVRLGQDGGEFLRVTDLEAQQDTVGGDLGTSTKPLLLRLMATGTHVGKAYTGKVEER